MIKIIDFHGSFTHSLHTTLLKSYSQVEIVDSENISIDQIGEGKPQALILTSSPGKPPSKIREIILKYAPALPILGLTSASLAMAEAYGGDYYPLSEIEYGKVVQVTYLNDDIFKGIPNPFEAGNFYAYAISPNHLPKHLKTIAATDKGVIMGIKHDSLPCYGFLFSIESLLTPQGDLLLKNFIKIAHKYGKEL